MLPTVTQEFKSTFGCYCGQSDSQALRMVIGLELVFFPLSEPAESPELISESCLESFRTVPDNLKSHPRGGALN